MYYSIIQRLRYHHQRFRYRDRDRGKRDQRDRESIHVPSCAYIVKKLR